MKLSILMKAFIFMSSVLALTIILVPLAYMYPEPTWKFGKSTTYKWSEVVVRGDTHSTKINCFVWVQSTQAWGQCPQYEKGKITIRSVEWSDQSLQVDTGLPPK